MTRREDSQVQIRVSRPRQKRWQDLSERQKIAIGLLGGGQVLLLAAALWDLHGRSPEEIKGPKWLWTAVSFINFFGPIAYFLFGRKKIPPK